MKRRSFLKLLGSIPVAAALPSLVLPDSNAVAATTSMPDPLSTEAISNIGARNGLTLIFGPSGSGKSQLMGSIFHEMIKSKPGKYHIYTHEGGLDPHSINSPDSTVYLAHYGTHMPDPSTAITCSLRRRLNGFAVDDISGPDHINLLNIASATGHNTIATMAGSGGLKESLTRVLSSFPDEARSSEMLKLIEHINTVVATRHVPSKNAGRTRLSETLTITPEVKADMHTLLSADGYQAVLDNMERIIQQYGTPFTADARRSYEHGLINRETLLRIELHNFS